MLVGEFVKAVIQLVVLFYKLAKLIVLLQQQVSYFLCFRCVHRPPLLISYAKVNTVRGRVLDRTARQLDNVIPPED